MKSALQIWELTAQQFPAETWLLRDIARARYDLGDFDGAIRDYRQASTLAPGDDTIRIDLAWSLLAASKFDEAHAICEEVLARDGTNRAALTILSRIAR
jgi:Flp pilus assembly protein TadD